MFSTRIVSLYPLCQHLKKLVISRKIFKKYSNIKLHEIPYSGSQFVPRKLTWRNKWPLLAIPWTSHSNAGGYTYHIVIFNGATSEPAFGRKKKLDGHELDDSEFETQQQQQDSFLLSKEFRSVLGPTLCSTRSVPGFTPEEWRSVQRHVCMAALL